MNGLADQLNGGIISGGLADLGNQGIYQPSHVTIPLSMENWKKLSRATQLAMLSELGILAAEPTIRAIPYDEMRKLQSKD